MDENEISHKIIGRSIQIHKKLGPGLLESVYENVLAYELRKSGLNVAQQVPIPFIYDEIKLEAGFRMDILVNNKVVLEIKSVEALAPLHHAQLLTYLKVSSRKLGLLINFNSVILKNNIYRIVNKL